MKAKVFWSAVLSLVFLFTVFTSVWATSFQNGDFETGNFTGWSGDLLGTVVDPDTDSHFTILSNAGPDNSYVAQLENDDYDWIVTLYQDFTLDTLLGPGYTMDITFWIKWTPTDSAQDEVSVILSDLGYTDSFDLLSGVSDADLLAGTWVTQDITSFAQTYGGQDVELAFSLWDIDLDTSDTLLIDNISFNQHAPANPVPEPATVVLLISGLGAIGVMRKRGSK